MTNILIIRTATDHMVYDLGENITGTYVFTCEDAGRTIEVACGEELGEDMEPCEKC